MQKQTKLWVLSVAIDEYKNNTISNLSGCLKDAEKLKSFFLGNLNIQPANYLSISNSEATRAAIIAAFRSHFAKLSEGDIALFHYSGHGSWENTSSEFITAKIEPPGGRNEVIVCHDSGDGGVLNIADKELRCLVAEIQGNFPGEKNKKIHFNFLFDCCHSGSILRQEENGFSVRMHPGKNKFRKISEYLEGQYFKNKPLVLPAVNYIALTACSPRESALENENGGIFTNALLTVLKEYQKINSYPSYVELFSIISEYVQQKTFKQQAPQFEYAGDVNPFNIFLQLEDEKSINYPQLIRKEQNWEINIGAIHGISWDFIKNLDVPLFKRSNLSKQIGKAQVAKVKLESTVLENIKIFPAFKDEIKLEEISMVRSHLEKNGIVTGLSALCFPIDLITKDCDLGLKNELTEKLRNNPFFCLSKLAKYTIILNTKTLKVIRRENKKEILITGLNLQGPNLLSSFLFLLNKIRKWEQINKLTNPKASLISPDKIKISFEYAEYSGEKKTWHSHSVTEDKKSVNVLFDPFKGPIPYSIKVENLNPLPLFFYLVHLDRKYNINQKNEAYLKELMPRESLYLYESKSKGLGLGIADSSLFMVNDIFIIIASVDRLTTPYSFEQVGLGDAFGQIITLNNEISSKHKTRKRDLLPLSTQEEVNWVVRKFIIKTIMKPRER